MSASSPAVSAPATGAGPERPYVLLSAAMSLDGAIDDTSPDRLVLSDAADLDRVDAERAGVDAILVGATTLRRDDPRLLVRDPARRAARTGDPVKVVISGSGDLDPEAAFFTTGDGLKLVYTSHPQVAAQRLGDRATVVDAGSPLDLAAVLADLRARGVERLMVEGGSAMHALFLSSGAVDEIQLVVAPFLVGEAAAPRFAGPGEYRDRLRLLEARAMGDHVLLHYRVETAAGTL